MPLVPCSPVSSNCASVSAHLTASQRCTKKSRGRHRGSASRVQEDSEVAGRRMGANEMGWGRTVALPALPTAVPACPCAAARSASHALFVCHRTREQLISSSLTSWTNPRLETTTTAIIAPSSRTIRHTIILSVASLRPISPITFPARLIANLIEVTCTLDGQAPYTSCTTNYPFTAT